MVAVSKTRNGHRRSSQFRQVVAVSKTRNDLLKPQVNALFRGLTNFAGKSTPGGSPPMTSGHPRPNRPVQISVLSALLAVALVVLTLAGFTTGLFGWHPGTPTAAKGSRSVNLPATVGPPGIRSADETKHPVAAAAVLISGNTWFADGSHWYGAVISADSGEYRVFVNNAGAAGSTTAD
ncbi:hypothetical protein [Actinoplanes sp. L3-i22]|uniref:hypothetical protein n=1 Tax=Actinoplanes sp. L3-i22 TaxID=2836373 RepID=UPI001C74466E|nr:hypothetical protein [Actinoplanes sp. L3-i22]BCY10602.1 hypothetical protein L3i22_056900 [Actinoplanes sp. L3-i22]